METRTTVGSLTITALKQWDNKWIAFGGGKMEKGRNQAEAIGKLFIRISDRHIKLKR